MRARSLVAAVAMAMGGIALAAPANAFAGYTVNTYVKWGGTSCVDMDSASGPKMGCAYNSWTETQYKVRPYSIVGVDPIMGDASWIHCDIMVDGVVVYSDYAAHGDGHDVNCLRKLT